MELFMVLAPLLAVIVFVRSKRHFTLVKWVNMKMKFDPHYPPIKGRGSLPWLTLPVSTLVLIGYLIRLIAWLQAHVLLVVLVIVAGVSAAIIWRKRSQIVEAASRAMPTDEPTLERARDKWRNHLLPDHMNND